MDDIDLLGPPKSYPQKSERYARRFQKTDPLYKLLLLACPPHPTTGKPSIKHIAALLDIKTEAIYKWLTANRVPPLQAATLVDLADGRVTIGDFSPYIFLENLDA